MLDSGLSRRLLADLARELQFSIPLPAETEEMEEPEEDAIEGTDDYEAWLKSKFPTVAASSLSERHHRLWRWFRELRPGVVPPAKVEIWPRGGAKSSTVELGCAYLAERRTRRFVLYVSGTQEQADLHVQSVAALLERMGIDRAIGKYGHSKGWRRDQLMTASGFAVSAYGLDTATRGVKIEEFRPDLIVFDDIDNQDDTPKKVKRKAEAITKAILPAGSWDCAALFVQNLIHEEGIVARLHDGRADFLHDRDVSILEPAVRGLQYEKVDRGDGRKLYRITGGEPTWEGQSLETCERQINRWGLDAFLVEAQHEVRSVSGFFFDETQFGSVQPDLLPKDLKLSRGWDLAATQGAGDYTAGVLMGYSKETGLYYVLDVKRHQFESGKVRSLIAETADRDAKGIVHKPDEFDKRGELVSKGREAFRFRGRVVQRLPQDPAQAGKDQAEQMKQMLAGYPHKIEPVSGSKAKRAENYAAAVNRGDVVLVAGAWHHDFKEEHRKFREDEEHEFDDQVDAASDAFNEIAPRTSGWDIESI